MHSEKYARVGPLYLPKRSIRKAICFAKPVLLHEMLMGMGVTGNGTTSVGPNSCGTGASSGGSGVITWSNAGNITASDSSYATAANLTNTNFTKQLIATNFGFSITGTTIVGIEFDWQTHFTGGSGAKDRDVYLTLNASTTMGTNQANGTTWNSSSDTYQNYGGNGNTWGASPTISNVNSSNFGCILTAQGTSGSMSGANVNYCRCTVWYQ